MATEAHISQADTASPVRRAALDGQIRRRERHNRMGAGGSDLRDPAVVPASLKAMELDPDDVTKVFRFLDQRVQDRDDRVEFLQIILGE